MAELRSFIREFVVESSRVSDQEVPSDNRWRQPEIFIEKKGPLWYVLREVFYILSLLAHISVAVTFLSFALTALSFSVNCALEIVLEMITPATDSTHRNNFYSFCLFTILLCVLAICLLVLSLFWDVVSIVLYKSGLRYTMIKIAFFFIDIIAAWIWSAVGDSPQTGFMLFLSKCLIVAWIMAFIVSIVVALLLLVFVYNESLENTIQQGQYLSRKRLLYVFITMFAISLLLSILNPIAFKLVDSSPGGIAFAFLMPFFTAILLPFLMNRGCKEGNHGFVIKKWICIVDCATFLVIVTVGATINLTCGKECQLGPPSKRAFMFTPMLTTARYQVPGYPICNEHWSSLQLEITDMAFLADTAYKIKSDNDSVISSIVREYFMGVASWDIVSVNNNKPFFFHARNHGKKVNVFSIRGTQDLRDWYENIKIWNEIAVFQLLSVAFPIQRLPFEFVAFFISKSSSLEYILNRSSYNFYFKPLEDYIRAVRNTSSDEEYYLVGHSLGGGLAKIIGSRNKIQAVAFSSPGEIYNHMKFEYTLKDVQKYTTTVRAQNDLVTWIDASGGLVQYVECDESDFLKCHNLLNTYCELKKKCHKTTPITCPGEPNN